MAVAALAATSAFVGMAGAQNQAAGSAAAAAYNATVKGYQAEAAVRQSQEDERRLRVEGKHALGAIRAGVAASGVQMDGSALDVLEMSASNAELDALTVRHQGQMKAWALKAGASLDLLEGQNALTAGNFAAAGYLLKGGTAAASSMGGGKGKGSEE